MCAACTSAYVAAYYHYSKKYEKAKTEHDSINSILLSIEDGTVHYNSNDISTAKGNKEFCKCMMELAEEGNEAARKVIGEVIAADVLGKAR
jgi:hypothetical protein